MDGTKPELPAPAAPCAWPALNGWEKAGLAAIVVVCVVFGAITVHRSAYLRTRRTDADVYFRAAWALKNGQNPYRVADPNGWHYHYPPLLAALLIPLADPPPDAGPESDAWLPYPAAIGVWYAVNLAALLGALVLLASALQRNWTCPALHEIPPGSRPWWRLRTTALLTCSVPFGFSLVRGQPNPLLLLCAAAFCHDLLRGKPFRSGVWVGLGCCVKPFLAVVLAGCLPRRRWPAFGGAALGGFLGLFLIPCLLVGPAATLRATSHFFELRLAGLASGSVEPEIRKELDVVEGNFPSYGVSLFKLLHPRAARPAVMPDGYRWFGFALAALLVLATLWVGREGATPGRTVLAMGALLAAATPAMPTCKAHYYALAAVMVAGLQAVSWERRGAPRSAPAVVALCWGFGAVCALEQLPGLTFLQELGVLPLAGLVLWGFAVRLLGEGKHSCTG